MGECLPLSLKVLGSNLVFEDLELGLPLSLVQLSLPQSLIQLQGFTTQGHYLVHLHAPTWRTSHFALKDYA